MVALRPPKRSRCVLARLGTCGNFTCNLLLSFLFTCRYDDKFLDPYVLYNVKGREAYDKQSRSYFNTNEALVVVALYYRLCMSSPSTVVPCRLF